MTGSPRGDALPRSPRGAPLAHSPLARCDRRGFRAGSVAGSAVPGGQSPQAADRPLPHRRRRKAGRDQPDRAGDDRLQARIHRRAGPRLAHHPVAALGLPGARALRSGEARAGAGVVRRPGAFSRRRRGRLRLRGAAGAEGAVQLPDRSHPAVHHLRRVFRLRAAGGARARPLVRAAARHHHPRVAGRDRPGGAGTVPTLRGGRGVRRRRGALAGHRPGLDGHDDDPAAAAVRGGVRGQRR